MGRVAHASCVGCSHVLGQQRCTSVVMVDILPTSVLDPSSRMSSQEGRAEPALNVYIRGQITLLGERFFAGATNLTLFWDRIFAAIQGWA